MRIISMLMLVLLAASTVSAEILTTTDPVGQGKCAISGSFIKDSKMSSNSDMDMSTWGANLGYGLTDKLDLYLNLASGSIGGLPAGFSMGLTSYGLTAQYALVEEGAGSPVGVAGKLGFKSINVSASVPIISGNPVSQYLAAVEVSKKFSLFTPYLALGYLQSRSAGSSDPVTQIGLTVGSAYAWLPNCALLLEYTQNSLAATGMQSYTSSQVGASVSYTL